MIFIVFCLLGCIDKEESFYGELPQEENLLEYQTDPTLSEEPDTIDSLGFNHYEVTFGGRTVTLEGFQTGTGSISSIGATLRAYSKVHAR